MKPIMDTLGRILHIGLVSTVPEGQLGSMANYAAIVSQAFDQCPKLVGVPIPLALPENRLARLPGRIRNYVHHSAAAIFASLEAPRVSIDMYHILDCSHAYLARLLPRKPCVGTCHDLVPWLQLEGMIGGNPPTRMGKWLIRQSSKALSRMDLVIADSHNTRSDLVKLGGVDPRKMSVVPLPLPPSITTMATQLGRRDWQDRRTDPDAYILHVGNNAFYKNRSGVLRIFREVVSKANVRLKMAGPPPDAAIQDLVRALELQQKVDFVVWPSQADLCNLYRNACLLLFPSIYEGFGLPPLEAMLFRCPVVCSNAASLPEIVGAAALTAPVEAEEQLAHLCLSVLMDAGQAGQLVRKGRFQIRQFTLRRFAEGLSEAYSHAFKSAIREDVLSARLK